MVNGLIVSLLVAVAGIVVGVWAVLSQELRPLTRRVLALFVIISVLLAVMQILSYNGFIKSNALNWQFNIKGEYNPSGMFSSLQLILVGLLAIFQGIRGEGFSWLKRFFWLFFGVGFCFLGIDEYYTLHEYMGLYWNIPWRWTYMRIGAAIGAIMAVIWLLEFRRERRVFEIIALGASLMALSGLSLEDQMYHAIGTYRYEDIFQLQAFEETLEIFGATLVLAALFIYAQQHLSELSWRWLGRLLPAAAVLWCGWGIFSVYGLPAIESSQATPVIAHYTGEKDSMDLVAYRLSQDRIQPGDTLHLDLYWRAQTEQKEEYSLSVHLLTHPDIDSVASAEEFEIGQYQNTGWIPGVTVRKTIPITIPDDLPTPASYWVMLRVWSGSWRRQKIQGLSVTETDRQQLDEDMIVLTSLPAVISDQRPPDPPIASQYHFAQGFTLYGYDLPEEVTLGGEMRLPFWWETEQSGTAQLTQFVHLFQVDGEVYTVFNRQPFDGTFPTQDWPDGIAVQDAWTIPLPDDLPPGEYRVQTGMIDSVGHDRIPITDADGQPVQDNSIVLGTVTIQSEGE